MPPCQGAECSYVSQNSVLCVLIRYTFVPIKSYFQTLDNIPPRMCISLFDMICSAIVRLKEQGQVKMVNATIGQPKQHETSGQRIDRQVLLVCNRYICYCALHP